MIRILLTKGEGISIAQSLASGDGWATINERTHPEYDTNPPEEWDGPPTVVAELTLEEVKEVFDTLREILEARL